MTIKIDPETCSRCGTCSDVCLMQVITPAEEGVLPHMEKGRSSMCMSCGQCVAFCPTGAIMPDSGDAAETIKSEKISADSLGTLMRSRRSIRKYRPGMVPRETIEAILDIARYAPSASNGQPVEWLVIHDPQEVKKVAALTIDWMRELVKSNHPMSAYAPGFITGWESGRDMICHEAPHLLVAHVPEENIIAPNDAIIALTHVDIAAPAFGLGTCWAGLVAMASRSHKPLLDFLSLPKGRVPVYAMMFGYPKYTPHQIPARKPLQITWR